MKMESVTLSAVMVLLKAMRNAMMVILMTMMVVLQNVSMRSCVIPGLL